MRPIDTTETGPGASSALRTADGAQRHKDYSLHYKWLKQSPGSAEAIVSGGTLSRWVLETLHYTTLDTLYVYVYRGTCPNDFGQLSVIKVQLSFLILS